MRIGPPSPRRRGRGAALALVLGMAVPACARQGAPPGGPVDRRPPLVVGTVPDTFAVVEAVRDPVRIQFNERISARPGTGTLDDAVLVSPRTGEVRVRHARDGLEVDLAGGFRPGLVYRVTLLPVITDMFGNAMREPFEFVFSTGGAFTPNVVAGVVLERTTGAPAEGYQVWLRRNEAGADTSVAHVAVTDTEGFFALRYLPTGRYELMAFQDLNRNRELEFSEARGSRSLLFREADTVIVEVPVLRPDTSRAVLGRAVPESPRSIRLEFDDFLDPDVPPANVGVALEPDTLAPDGAPPAPAVERVLHAPAWEAYRDSVRAAESPDAPEAAPPPAVSRIPRPGQVPTTPGQERGRVVGEPLPTQSLYAVLEAPLPANVPYRVTVTGVLNINGIPFGGGTAVVVRQPEAADTAGVVQDTAGMVPDTAALAPDTAIVVPDTAGVAADTTVVAPDTTGVAPDTTGMARDTTDMAPDTAGLAPDTVSVAWDAAGLAPNAAGVASLFRRLAPANVVAASDGVRRATDTSGRRASPALPPLVGRRPG